MLYIIKVKLYYKTMSEISTQTVENAVYRLCFEANTCLNKRVYKQIFDEYELSNGENRQTLTLILKNAKIAYEKKMPLCQDTGQVIVFLEIGQDVTLRGKYINDAINDGIKRCYEENFFRKSTVKNAVFDRTNTNSNTPAIIHTKITQGDEIKISVLIKGAGSENKTGLKMELPTAGEEEIIKAVGDIVLSADENACPPMFIGVGAGSSADMALIMSKEALISEDFSNEEMQLGKKIKNYINSNSIKKYGRNFVLDVKIKTNATHIASLPIGVTINCHSNRYSKCTIKGENVVYEHETPDFKEIEENHLTVKEIHAEDIEAVKALKKGDKILLSGEIYVARDMAHKRLLELIEQNKPLPIEIKDKIILYAGPCPAKTGEIIGSIGPTTAGRMDKYAVKLYDMGLLATIGKGGRSKETTEAVKRNNAKYFTITGGIAALLAQKIKKCEIVAFNALGTEALYKIFVEKLLLKVDID